MDFGLVEQTAGDGGSGKIKRERSAEFSLMKSDVCNTSLSSSSSTLLMRSGDSNGRESNSNSTTTMLSFSSSSPKSEEIPFLSVIGEDSSRTIGIPFFQSQQKQSHHSSSVSVYTPGGLNEGARSAFSWCRGPFTPSQWMELEHQALIYKHLMTNVPIPSNLLFALKKSLSPYMFSGLSSASYASNWGWGTFHLGFAGNTDPEPGRCRRTDGKKWRCSRDAVPDQKYCERHINRGRHRSRKPVEGQNGRAASGVSASKAVRPVASSSSSPSLVSTAAAAANPSTHHLTTNRTQGSSVISPSVNLKQHNPLEQSSHSEFGFLSHENSKHSLNLDFNCHATNEQLPIHHFTDSWAKEQPPCGSVSWTGEELKSDWTQLSMSIPVSSQHEKQSFELDPSNNIGELTQRTSSNWLPVSWGNSMGGPLGEVLNNTSGNVGACKSSSGLNLMTEIWDSNPQKSDLCLTLKNQFGKQSREDGNLEDGVSCDEVMGSNLVSSIPSINVCL